MSTEGRSIGAAVAIVRVPEGARRRVDAGQAGVGSWYPHEVRKAVASVVLVLFLLAGGWLLLGGATPHSADGAQAGANRALVTEVERDRASPEREVEAPREPSKRVRSKQARDAMRRRIVDAMHARERVAEEREGEPAGGGGAASSAREARAEPPAEEDPVPGNLTDRTGNHGYLVKVMNDDLMPLADECYALARETQPELEGMLVLDVEIIGDEDVGGVVETVAIGQANELTDPGLVECVRESLLSTTLPPPPEGGKDAISLSLRLEPDEG